MCSFGKRGFGLLGFGLLYGIVVVGWGTGAASRVL